MTQYMFDTTLVTVAAFLAEHNEHYAGKSFAHVQADLKQIAAATRSWTMRNGVACRSTVGMVATYWRAGGDAEDVVRVRFAVEEWFARTAIEKAKAKAKVANALASTKAYRDKMEFPMENLAIQLEKIGFMDRKNDDELVEVAARKLSTLYKMLLASDVNEKILKAVMAE